MIPDGDARLAAPSRDETAVALPVGGARLPSVLTAGRWSPSTEVEGMARRWHSAALRAIEQGARYVAAAPPNTHEGVALVAAVTASPVPGILLEPSPETWNRVGPLPSGTTLLAPSAVPPQALAHLGCTTTELSHDAADTGEWRLPLLQSPALVVFTSGSTGAPKPVFRSLAAIVGTAAARLVVLGVPAGAGIVAGTSLAHAQGVSCLVSAMLLGGPLGLLSPLNHRGALATLALPEFGCWWATPHFADVLGRCELRGEAIVPRICLISSPIPRGVFDRFRDRFGVPLRQTYSSTETGCISVDAAAPAEVRHGTVGRVIPGVEIRIGDDPGKPVAPGDTGRIWVRSPWMMTGYGFSPDIRRPGDVDGWWPTRDRGWRDADGQLSLAGRLDDCIRTRDGQLVNLAAVTEQLQNLHGIAAAVVVRLETPAGASFGAVIECGTSRSPSAVRTLIAEALPAWARPRTLAVVEALPRLPNGKPDRLACQATLTEEAER